MSKKILTIGAIIMAPILLYYYYNNDPTKAGFFPKCIFKSITNLHCPGCGVQRSFHALLHGELINAASFNLFFILVICISLGLFIIKIVNKKLDIKKLIENKYISKTIVVFVILFWVLRNINIWPFSWLAP